MIRLNLTPGPVTVTIDDTVSMTLMPFTTAMLIDARAEVADRLGADAAAEVVTGTGPARVAFVQALVRAAIIGWTGFEGPDGAALEPSDEAVDIALGHLPPIYNAVNNQYVIPGLLGIAEGNGFATSLPGTTAAGSDIAPAAAPAAPTAPTRSTAH